MGRRDATRRRLDTKSFPFVNVTNIINFAHSLPSLHFNL